MTSRNNKREVETILKSVGLPRNASQHGSGTGSLRANRNRPRVSDLAGSHNTAERLDKETSS